MSELEVSHNNMELRAIPELLDKKFFIPEYQRGYRWESAQVQCLLDDLLSYFSDTQTNASFYCLQPVVVKLCDTETKQENNLDGNDWYEVIDGQQRLTTIRILCSILDCIKNTPKRHSFVIRYSTRTDMDGIYESLKAPYDELDKKWKFEKGGREWNNLDSVYIYNAAITIVEWFNGNENRADFFSLYFFNSQDEENENICNPVKKSVQVVWYEDCGKKDARDLFNEINDLTVKLSCSELIRSLFLSSNANYKSSIHLKGLDEAVENNLKQQDRENRQRYVNTKWDEIEHRLSDKRMQAFMTNITHEGLRNNIELLFDLISKKYVGAEPEKKDPVYTFIFFYEEMKKKDASELWQLVEKYYSTLCGWMENSDYYHKVGYLNALSSDDSTISELLNYAEKHKKQEMMVELDNRIRKSIQLDGRTWSSLNYQVKRDYDYIRRLLFLYNVELQRRVGVQQFFPFEQFKPLNSWTLEHIHAQNSECLPPDDRKVWKQWAHDNAETLESLRFDSAHETKRQELIVRLHLAENGFSGRDKSYSHKTVITLFDDVANLYNLVNTENSFQRPEPVHQLTNMALLNHNVNASIGCSAFAVKRLKIISLHNKGKYFPIGTMNVFQKSYSKNQQLYEWSYQDRRSYLASLKWVLRNYITID